MRAEGADVEFGFMMGVSPREPIRRAGTLAREAEELGFGAMWLADSQLYLKNSYVALTIAALETERIHLGPGVTNPLTRHLTVTANAAAALAEVSNGRFELGLGSGDASVFPLGLKPSRLAKLGESVEQLRTLAAGDEVEIDGRALSVAPRGAYPIFISASQPRMLRLAGAVADGAIVMGAADPGLTRWQLDQVAAGACEAGRDPESIFIDLWFAISLSEDREQAIRDVRPWATSQARWFHQWKELPEPLLPYREELKAAYDAYDFSRHLSRHEGGTPAVSDEFVDWIGVAGDGARCVEKIRPLADMGIDRITFALLPGGRSERLQRYGKDLIPALHAAAARS